MKMAYLNGILDLAYISTIEHYSLNADKVTLLGGCNHKMTFSLEIVCFCLIV